MTKQDASGNLLWVNTYGGTSNEEAKAVAVDRAGNIFVTGHFFGTANFGGANLTSGAGIYASDIFAAKYDSSGNHLWSKRIGGVLGNNYGTSIAVDASGNVFVGGQVSNVVDLGGGDITMVSRSTDGFVVKLAGTDGQYIWGRSFGSTGSDYVGGIAVDSSGDVIVGGSAYGDINLGNGIFAPVNPGSSDLFIVKYAGTDGHYLWSRVTGGPGSDGVSDVAIDANQNIIVTGAFYGSVDLGGITLSLPSASTTFIAKYNGGGDLTWAKAIARDTLSGAVGVRKVAVDSTGNLAITGNLTGGADFGSGTYVYGTASIYVAKYNPQGHYLWVKTSVNTGYCAGYGLAIDGTRNVLATGSIQESVTFDGLQVSSPGIQVKSGYVLKISP